MQQVSDWIYDTVTPPIGLALDWIYDYSLLIGALLLVTWLALEIFWHFSGRKTAMNDPSCVFCQIIAGDAPATVVREWRDAIAIVPLNPVTEGHVIVLPRRHSRDARENPRRSGRIAQHAAELAAECHAANIIASCGPEASQTIFHEHWHVAPRRANDGLPLLWTGQVRSGTS